VSVCLRAVLAGSKKNAPTAARCVAAAVISGDASGPPVATDALVQRYW
jgi:hypothetical protein